MILVEPNRMKQLAYIGLTDADLEYLNQHKDHFAAITNVVVDQLYDNISAQSELAQIISANSTIERLKETQRWYFMTLVSGKIDNEYIEKRLYVGKLHSRIGLTTDWYLGTYMSYLDIAVQNLQRVVPEQWMPIILCLSKMFNFDSQLVLEAYEQEEKHHIQTLYEERQATVSKVNRAVQDLAAMMVQLSGSSQSVADSATHTADIQDQAHIRINQLRENVDEINAMGDLLHEISNQTHLLGLNASIEAAHAGEHGRGFGIVASEIRKLAEHSKDSLKVIRTTLKEISTALNEVMQNSIETSTLARNQAASSQELTSFVTMIETVTAELENIR